MSQIQFKLTSHTRFRPQNDHGRTRKTTPRLEKYIRQRRQTQTFLSKEPVKETSKN
jgi:hypothetical protein